MKNNPQYYACIINDVINEAIKNNIEVIYDGGRLLISNNDTDAIVSFQNLSKLRKIYD